MGASASVQDESLAAKNKEDIVKHEEILKEKVAADLQELKTKFKELVTTVNSKLTELRDYTKDAIEKLQEDTTAHMNAGDTTIKENIKNLEEHIRNKVNEVNEKMVENLKALSKASAKQRKDIRDWNNERRLCQRKEPRGDVQQRQRPTLTDTRAGRCWGDRSTTTRPWQ